MNLHWLYNLWNDSIDISIYKMILIGAVIMIFDFSIFITMWYVRRAVAIEYGYPKRNKKYISKKLKTFSIIEQLLLFKITYGAEHKGILLIINLGCHCINMIAFVLSVIGYIGCIVTCASGWALTLLVLTEILTMFVTVTIEFIPHLIWLPTEYKRYKP